MYAIKDLEKATGFTINQLRERLRLVSPIFADDVRRGSRGKIIVGDKILAALRRLRDLEKQGLSLGDAQAVIQKDRRSVEIDEILNVANGELTLTEGDPRSLLREKDERIAELKERVRDLQEENGFLRARIEELIPLALPRPRRRWWPWRRQPAE